MLSEIIQGDCLEIMKQLDDDSVDLICTDPPYGVAFMGKAWDKAVPSVDVWRGCLRVLKPGAFAFVMSLPRQDCLARMICNLEDAGFTIAQSSIYWCFATGFPKLHNVGRAIDAKALKTATKVCKALDNLIESDILSTWKEYSRSVKSVVTSSLKHQRRAGQSIIENDTAPVNVAILAKEGEKNIQNVSNDAKSAAKQFPKSRTETGMNTPRNDFALELAAVLVIPNRLNADAIIAELSSAAPHLTKGESEGLTKSMSFVPSSVAKTTMVSNVLVPIAASLLEDPEAWSLAKSVIAPINVCGSQCEPETITSMAAEVLLIWLGKRPSLNREAIDAICAALTDDLKRIILSQSKTFRNLDIKSQTDFVSATSVIITEFTAECLISSMVDIARSKAIDRKAGKERKVTETTPDRWTGKGNSYCYSQQEERDIQVPINTAPATPEAAIFEGWCPASSLKPALEVIIVVQKPMTEKTYAAQALKSLEDDSVAPGCLNMEAGRIPCLEKLVRPSIQRNKDDAIFPLGAGTQIEPQGRFPANLVCGSGIDINIDLLIAAKNGGSCPNPYLTEDGKPTETLLYTLDYFGLAVEQFIQMSDSQITAMVKQAGDVLNDGRVSKDSICNRKPRDGREIWGNAKGVGQHCGFGDVGSFSRYFSLDAWAEKAFSDPVEVDCAACGGTGQIAYEPIQETFEEWVAKTGEHGGTRREYDKLKNGEPVACLLCNGTGKVIKRRSRLAELPEGVQRTFPFLITPKPSKREKNKGCEGLPERVKHKENMLKSEWNTDSRSLNGGYKNNPSIVARNNHPTTKPVTLFSWLITLGSREGQLVLDPFVGSGTTGVAAKILKRDFVGIERESDYCKIAECRIAAVDVAIKQPKIGSLFDAE